MEVPVSYQRCRILMFRGRGLLSALIRWVTGSRYSHCAIELPCGDILEAWQGRGVRRHRLADYDGVHRYVVAVAPSEWQLACRFADAQIGRRYDYWGIVRYLLRRPRYHPADAWFCSSLVFAALQHAGVNLLKRTPAGAVTPGLLALSPLLTRT